MPAQDAGQVHRALGAAVVGAVVGDRQQVGQLGVQPSGGPGRVSQVGDGGAQGRESGEVVPMMRVRDGYRGCGGVPVVVQQLGQRRLPVRLGLGLGCGGGGVAPDRVMENVPAGSGFLEQPLVQ